MGFMIGMDFGAVVQVLYRLAVSPNEPAEVEEVDPGCTKFFDLRGPPLRREKAAPVGIGVREDADVTPLEPTSCPGVYLRGVAAQKGDREGVKDPETMAKVKCRKQIGSTLAHQNLSKQIGVGMTWSNPERPTLVRTGKSVSLPGPDVAGCAEGLTVESPGFCDETALVAKDTAMLTTISAESEKSQTHSQAHCRHIDSTPTGEGLALERSPRGELRQSHLFSEGDSESGCWGNPPGHGDEARESLVQRNAEHCDEKVRAIALRATCEALESTEFVEKIEGRISVTIQVPFRPEARHRESVPIGNHGADSQLAAELRKPEPILCLFDIHGRLRLQPDTGECTVPNLTPGRVRCSPARARFTFWAS